MHYVMRHVMNYVMCYVMRVVSRKAGRAPRRGAAGVWPLARAAGPVAGPTGLNALRDA